MARQSVAYRLVSEGKAQLINDFREIGESGGASAKRIGRDFAREAADAEAAIRKLEATAAKLAMAAPNSTGATNASNPIFASRYGAVGSASSFGGGSRSAEASAQALIAEQDRLLAQRNAILAQIDPLFAAQMRYNDAIETATALRRREILTEEQFVAVERAAKASLDEVANSQLRGGAASGAMRAGFQQAGFQAQDFIVQVAGGTSAIRAFTLQAPQMVGALQLMTSGVEGGAGRFAAFARFLGGGWGVAAGVAIPLVAMLAEKLMSEGDAADAAKKSSMSLADAQAEVNRVMALDRSGNLASAARDLAGARMQQAVATIQAARAEAALAQASARKRLDDIADGAETRQVTRWERIPGSRGRRQVTVTEDVPISDRRARGQGSVLDRERTLAQQQYDASTASLTRYDTILNRVSSTTLRTALASDTSLRDARLKLATATDNVARAEAQRDIVERQARLRMEATAVGTAARSKAEAEYTRVVKAANLEVEKIRDAERQAGRERRDSARAAREAAKEQRELMQAMVAMEQRYDPVAAAARNSRSELEQIAKLSAAGLISSEQAANWSAQAQAKALLPGFADQMKAQADEEERAAKALERMRADQGEELEYLNLRQRMIGANDNEMDAQLSKLRLIQSARREGVDTESDEFAAILATNDALEERRRVLNEQAKLWEETRRFGEQAIDRLFDTRSAESWGDRVKGILRDLVQEMLVLAAINPLKNALFGSGLPTLGGSGSGLFGLLGGGKSGGGNSFLPTGASSLPTLAQIIKGGWSFNPVSFLGKAVGTERTSGGAMWLAENGPELVNLPEGSRVTPAAETRRLLSGANDNRPMFHIPISIDATGADAAGLARVEAKVEQLRAELPAQIASTMTEFDGRTHGRWRAAGGR